MPDYHEIVSRYISQTFAAQDKALQQASAGSARQGLPAISVKPEEGRFLTFLVRAGGARRALEIGTLGGYSGICIARGLAPGGKLITLDIEPKHVQAAREHFAAAGLSDMVEIRVGNARKLLAELSEDEPFDFVFIDADKENYPYYFDWAFDHTRIGGVIAAHNALRSGKVAGLGELDQVSKLMQEFNLRVANEPGVISTIYPAGDGTLVAVKII